MENPSKFDPSKPHWHFPDVDAPGELDFAPDEELSETALASVGRILEVHDKVVAAGRDPLNDPEFDQVLLDEISIALASKPTEE